MYSIYSKNILLLYDFMAMFLISVAIMHLIYIVPVTEYLKIL